MATLGHYELVREIGGGGMSTVYEAVDTRIGRSVALKVLTLPPYLSQDQTAVLIERLKREARAAGQLSHPNIVTVYDVGEQEGHHYIAMEYLNGVSLRARLKRGPLPVHEAGQILDRLADALDAAHAQGVLHRDIKPENILLLPDGRVKLADFGVARRVQDATLTQVGQPVGSPAYMAPEQIRGEAASPASDRWSLGVLLYEMLAGRPPFGGENIPAVLHQVVYDPAPPPADVSPEIQAVLDRALAKDPALRYDSSHELAAAFQRAMTGPEEATQTTPIGIPTQRSQTREPEVAGVKGGEVAARRPRLRPRVPLWVGAAAVCVLAAAILPLLIPAGPHALHRTGRPDGLRQRAGPRDSASRAAPAVIVREISPPRETAAGHIEARRSLTQKALPARQGPPRRLSGASDRSHAVPWRRRVSEPRRRWLAKHRQGVPVAEAPTARAPIRPPHHAALAPYPLPSIRATKPIAALPDGEERHRPGAGPAALNARAYRLQRRGRQAEAEPLLREAVRRDPRYAYAQYNLGVSLLSQGKTREALGPLHRTAAQQPKRWEPEWRLGQAYEQLGESARARAAYARARALRSRRGAGASPARETVRSASGEGSQTGRWRNRRQRTGSEDELRPEIDQPASKPTGDD